MATRRMLINATPEVRVAIVEGRELSDVDVETGPQQNKANIYKGKISRVERSLEAAFVEYKVGKNTRQGFLSVKEISAEYLTGFADYKEGISKIDLIEEGQEVIVQVAREERGTKGAALTTYISLAGCYLVLMPNNPDGGGISRKIEGEDRAAIKEVLEQIKAPEGMGVIIRTAGLGRNIEELRWDLDVLLRLWDAIKNVAQNRSAPFLIHRESDVINRAVRDYLKPDIGEILVDNESAFKKTREYVKNLRPEYLNKVKQYKGSNPLFEQFHIESQIETAFQREIKLRNGGAIVIDVTEALISIDINSAKATEGSDIEETALNTNLAAAKEIARQLRLRDIGGLIVIDFIDMLNPKNQRAVENCLRDSLTIDKARVQVGKISRFGLLEMSRQRIRPSLDEHSQINCPRCKGQGRIRNVKSLSLAILRVVHENAIKPQTAQIQIQVPTDVASYILNEQRKSIYEIEKRYKIRLIVIPNENLLTPDYLLKRIRREQDKDTKLDSFELKEEVNKQATAQMHNELTDAEAEQEPAINLTTSLIAPAAPLVEKKEEKTEQVTILKRLWSSFFSSPKPKEKSKPWRRNYNKKRGYKRKSFSGGSKPNGHKNHPRGNSRGNYKPRSKDSYKERDSEK